jgi:hypothetical protein
MPPAQAENVHFVQSAGATAGTKPAFSAGDLPYQMGGL